MVARKRLNVTLYVRRLSVVLQTVSVEVAMQFIYKIRKLVFRGGTIGIMSVFY